jgi:hypothetical protein
VATEWSAVSCTGRHLPSMPQGALEGYSRGNRGVLEGCLMGSRGVLTGCSRGTHWVLEGYSAHLGRLKIARRA